MPKKTSSQIRQEFLNFFAEKNHAIVQSAPVVPKNDPTLLFTNAGMNQFKSIFLGEEKYLKHEGKNWSRAVDTQKCIRVSGKHNDLEEVGHDTYHHTLFEMLGNWSFGDYFKKEAIGWGWELLVDKWGLDPTRLYATVFEGDKKDGLPVDDEAINLWKSETSISHEHILECGKKDNFWEMGETGPCGPCSEIHIDLRSDEEREKVPGASLVNKDDPRVMEIWNLVFIQFNRKADASLEKLPAQHVDTGMGFERVCAVLQGKISNYDSDVFTPLLNKISKMAGLTYGKDEEKDIAMRVIADHIRAVTFSIADGASPGNDGRGYVIRRILRRAIRYGWDKLNFKDPFFYKLVDVLADQFKEVFPEIEAQKEYIVNVIRAEEKSFLKTLGQGIELFNEMVKGKKRLSGEDAFKLHDTYGFPIDLTQLMARERGVEVDVDGFNKYMNEQRTRARAAGKFSVEEVEIANWNPVSNRGLTLKFFKGYDQEVLDTHIQSWKKITSDRFVITLLETPFYAESGGQVADIGKLITSTNQIINVLDVKKENSEHFHYTDGIPDDEYGTLTAKINTKRRREIQKHHSATHLVHAALRGILGDHVAQKGSLVDENHLRFDFSHYEAMTDAQLDEVEELVNQKIQENIEVNIKSMPIGKARELGAMMLFGEKYSENVRVVTFDENFSIELCGGTHVKATGEIGYFRFTTETSVAAGIRRIEAVCGKHADELLRDEKKLLQKIKGVVGQSNDPAADVMKLIEEKKMLEKQLDKIQMQNTGAKLDDLVKNPESLDGDIRLVKGEIPGADMAALKQLGYDALQKTKEKTAIVLGSKDEAEGKVYVMVALTDDLIKEKGLKAGTLVGQLGRLVGGGGGGQPSLATAGGKNPEKLDEALNKVNQIITESIQ
ncbi:MAG: alanine--tRNA ligase [Balneolaceae bacterium]